MATRTIARIVNDGQPTPRVADLKTEDWLAQAAPKPRFNDREQRIIQAHKDGATLNSIILHSHTHPATLFKLLGMNPAENAEVYSNLLDEFNTIRTRALK